MSVLYSQLLARIVISNTRNLNSIRIVVSVEEGVAKLVFLRFVVGTLRELYMKVGWELRSKIGLFFEPAPDELLEGQVDHYGPDPGSPDILNLLYYKRR